MDHDYFCPSHGSFIKAPDSFTTALARLLHLGPCLIFQDLIYLSSSIRHILRHRSSWFLHPGQGSHNFFFPPQDYIVVAMTFMNGSLNSWLGVFSLISGSLSPVSKIKTNVQAHVFCIQGASSPIEYPGIMCPIIGIICSECGPISSVFMVTPPIYPTLDPRTQGHAFNKRDSWLMHELLHLQPDT